ncbi:MAG: hypothetical protein ABL895_10455 [Cyclobacteriaceae bacterium]
MEKQNRKEFLLAGLSLAAIATYFFKGGKPPEKKKTIKFLAQDGRLVEIDADKLPGTKKVATKADVQNWIKK